jgi:predicted GIY-YIG superfamily endonuclease
MPRANVKWFSTRQKGIDEMKKAGRKSTETVTLRVAKGVIRRDKKEKGRSCQLYKQYAADGTLLYVGISDDAMVRTGQHAKAPWAHQISRIEIANFPTRARALKAETWAIETDRPVFNQRKKIDLMSNAAVGRATGFTLEEAYALAAKGERINTIEPVEYQSMSGVERRRHNRELSRLARDAKRRHRISGSENAVLE